MQKLFIGRFLQTQAHIFIIVVKLPDFAFILCLKHIFKITVLNLLHRGIQLVNGIKYAFLYPLCQHNAGKNQDNGNCEKHIL